MRSLRAASLLGAIVIGGTLTNAQDNVNYSWSDTFTTSAASSAGDSFVTSSTSSQITQTSSVSSVSSSTSSTQQMNIRTSLFNIPMGTNDVIADPLLSMSSSVSAAEGVPTFMHVKSADLSSASKGKKKNKSGLTKKSHKVYKQPPSTKLYRGPTPSAPVLMDNPKPSAPVLIDNPKPSAPVLIDNPKPSAPVLIDNPKPSGPIRVGNSVPTAPVAVGNQTPDLTFEVYTLEINKDGRYQSTMDDQVGNALIGGPALLLGAVSSEVLLEVCDMIVNKGQFSFVSEISFPGKLSAPVKTVLNLEATGGCGNPLAPAGIQTKFKAQSGNSLGVVCRADFQKSEYCTIWIYGPGITSFWTSIGKGNRNLNARSDVDAFAKTTLATRRTEDCALDFLSTGLLIGGTTYACFATPPTGAIPIGFCYYGIVGTLYSINSLANCLVPPKGCFPGNVEVITPSGRVQMSEVKVGDQVATSVSADGVLNFDFVYFLGHNIINVHSYFHRIELRPLKETPLENSVELKTFTTVDMTGLHYVPVLVPRHDKQTGIWINTRAKDVRVGDIILALSQDELGHQAASKHVVTQVTMLLNRGLFNPFTMSGNILVNNVTVSCYAGWKLDGLADLLGLTAWMPSLYHVLLTPLRVVVRLLGVDLYVKASIAARLTRIANDDSADSYAATIVSVAASGALFVALFYHQRKKNSL